MIEQLRVPDATLHVDRRGSGPTLLLVVAGGRESRDAGLMPWFPVPALAARLDRVIATFPGAHLGYRTHPDAFADELAQLLLPA